MSLRPLVIALSLLAVSAVQATAQTESAANTLTAADKAALVAFLMRK